METVGSIPSQSSPQNQLAGSAAATKGAESADRLPETQRVIETPRAEEQLAQKDPEQARFEAIKDAAQRQIANSFAVSDSRFTIYKQIEAGNPIYITRFTSLKDGSVTVIPEPQLLKDLSSGGSLLSANV